MNESLSDMQWKIYTVGDEDWYLARSYAEARQAWIDYVGGEEDIADELEIRELTPEEMESLKFTDEEFKLTDWFQWKCTACGAMGNGNCRWNGFEYEHPCGYPVGHMPMRHIHQRSFTEQLERVLNSPHETRPTLFASTEW